MINVFYRTLFLINLRNPSLLPKMSSKYEVMRNSIGGKNVINFVIRGQSFHCISDKYCPYEVKYFLAVLRKWEATVNKTKI